MADKKPETIDQLVKRGFGDINKDNVSSVQLYITIVIQKIDQLESTFLKSSISAVATLIIFFFITNRYLAEIEVGGVKIEQLQQLIPFLPLYLGFLFYMMCSSMANAVNLEEIAKRSFEYISPGFINNPIGSIFMIRTFLGFENQDLVPAGNKFEKKINFFMMVSIFILLLIGSTLAMIWVSVASIEGEYLQPAITWGFVIIGALLTLRGYVYLVANLEK